LHHSSLAMRNPPGSFGALNIPHEQDETAGIILNKLHSAICILEGQQPEHKHTNSGMGLPPPNNIIGPLHTRGAYLTSTALGTHDNDQEAKLSARRLPQPWDIAAAAAAEKDVVSLVTLSVFWGSQPLPHSTL
jgi:hypothetical protein